MDYRIIVVILLLFIFYLPVFSGLIDTWTRDPYYSHGFIILPISLFLAYRKRASLKLDDKDFTLGAAILGGGLAVYGFGYLDRSVFLSSLSLIIVLAGLVLAFYGRKALKELSFPIAFLIFMVPLPYIDYFSVDLQGLTAYSSAGILNAAGIPVTLKGTLITLNNQNFVVGEPCSGLRTLLALLALTALFAYFINGTLIKKTILFLLAIPIAILSNIIRVSSILLVANYFGTDAAMDYFHGLASPLLFLSAFILLIFVSRCLGCREPRNTSQ